MNDEESGGKKVSGRRILLLLALPLLLAAGFVIGGLNWAMNMPGQPHEGPLPVLSEAARELAERLSAHTHKLAGEIGPRNAIHPESYAAAVEYIEHVLREYGCDPERETFTADGEECHNILAEHTGVTRPEEILIVGAHYDSVMRTSGADDNASAVAVLLELAGRACGRESGISLRFAFFCNEEPPHFGRDTMGSYVHARASRLRDENLRGMICLEMLGYYTSAPGSQRYPIPDLDRFYPTTGNFVAFVGNPGSRALTREAIGSFRQSAEFPAWGMILPESISTLDFSDHRSFWAEGCPAVLVTDTAFYRNPHYHRASDLPDTLDYESMARVTEGLDAMLREIAG